MPRPEGELDFPNLMRTQLLSALATLKIGLDILAGEQVAVDRLLEHGGFFKTPVVGKASWPRRQALRYRSWRPPAMEDRGMACWRLPGKPGGGRVPGGLFGPQGLCRGSGVHLESRSGGCGRL